jgi:hypothetical protein
VELPVWLWLLYRGGSLLQATATARRETAGSECEMIFPCAPSHSCIFRWVVIIEQMLAAVLRVVFELNFCLRTVLHC